LTEKQAHYGTGTKFTIGGRCTYSKSFAQ
jgi:hypothetical protein